MAESGHTIAPLIANSGSQWHVFRRFPQSPSETADFHPISGGSGSLALDAVTDLKDGVCVEFGFYPLAVDVREDEGKVV